MGSRATGHRIHNVGEFSDYRSRAAVFYEPDPREHLWLHAPVRKMPFLKVLSCLACGYLIEMLLMRGRVVDVRAVFVCEHHEFARPENCCETLSSQVFVHYRLDSFSVPALHLNNRDSPTSAGDNGTTRVYQKTNRGLFRDCDSHRVRRRNKSSPPPTGLVLHKGVLWVLCFHNVQFILAVKLTDRLCWSV